MYFMFLGWKLHKLDHPVTFDELRKWVASKARSDFTGFPGVRLKTWVSYESTGVWGAIYIVDDPEAVSMDKLPRLPNGKTGPIGVPPHFSTGWLDVEATVFGDNDPTELPLLGLVPRTTAP
ncbi:hypothetical protein ACWEKR_18350 [Nocardia sp. NPDC004573]